MKQVRDTADRMADDPVRQLVQQGLAHHRAGDPERAETAFRAALAQDPHHCDALHMLGIIRYQRGDLAEGVRFAREAVQAQPRIAQLWNTLGNLLKAAGETTEAEQAYRHGLSLKGDMVEAWHNLGALLNEQKRYEEAIGAFAEVINRRVPMVASFAALGHAFLRLGRAQDAIFVFNEAIRLDPNNAVSYHGLGEALRNVGRTTEAMAAFTRATQLAPNLPFPHGGLALTLADQGRVEEADAVYRNALALAPDSPEANSDVLMCQNYLWPVRPEITFREHVMWGRRHALKVATDTHAHNNTRDPQRRLRIGYVSGDFRRHSVAYFIEPLIAGHDRQQFEVYCYSDVIRPDDCTSAIKGHADVWRDMGSLTDAQLADRIREDQIDILIDLAGHTRGNRLLAFAREPAPVQVSYLGYPNTTGVEAIGYRITDHWADPDAADAWHTEKLVRLPRGLLCYRPDADAPPVSDLPASANGFITFASFNNLAKVSLQTMRLWGRILSEIPGSKLLLKYRSLDDEPTRALVRERLASAGVPTDRVELIGHQATHHEHLAMYARADIALDPFPYNGTTTSCEALWMGVPVVTLAGTVHPARVGASILNSAGIPELIASNDDECLQVAANLAQDLGSLSQLRTTLRDRISHSSLRDERAFTREVDGAYRKMWTEWCT